MSVFLPQKFTLTKHVWNMENRKRGRDDLEGIWNFSERYDSSDVETSSDAFYSSQDSILKNSFMNSTIESELVHKAKREQKLKIHTEAHQRTVAMMMEAAKRLEFAPETDSTEREMQETEPHQDTYIQRPYW